jgi:peptide deformylase
MAVIAGAAILCAVVDIVQAGDPVLRRRAEAVSLDALATPFVQQLIATMVQTMRSAPGVGLAAPQLGESLRILVMEDDNPEQMAAMSQARRVELRRERFGLHVVVNPVLEPVGEETDEFFEGCLSVDGYRALVVRHRRVHLSGWDAAGAPVALDLEGWPARIAQHECDHLDGILYVERMDPRTFTTNANLDRWWKARPAGEIHRALAGD